MSKLAALLKAENLIPVGKAQQLEFLADSIIIEGWVGLLFRWEPDFTRDTCCRLYLWPPPMTVAPSEVFDICKNRFLHPEINRLLGGYLLQADASVRDLKLQNLTLEECDRLLASLLPQSYKTAPEPTIPWEINNRWVRSPRLRRNCCAYWWPSEKRNAHSYAYAVVLWLTEVVSEQGISEGVAASGHVGRSARARAGGPDVLVVRPFRLAPRSFAKRPLDAHSAPFRGLCCAATGRTSSQQRQLGRSELARHPTLGLRICIAFRHGRASFRCRTPWPRGARRCSFADHAKAEVQSHAAEMPEKMYGIQSWT